jgi:predicted transcriptional regulator
MPDPWRELEDWMTEMDVDILLLMSNEMVLSPTVIAENIGRSRSAISRRLNSLDAGGLVNKLEEGKYRISDEGLKMILEEPDEYGESTKYIDQRADEYVNNPQKYALKRKEVREIIDEFDEWEEIGDEYAAAERMAEFLENHREFYSERMGETTFERVVRDLRDGDNQSSQEQ